MDKKMVIGFAAGAFVTASLLVTVPDIQLPAALATTQNAPIPSEWSPTKPYPEHDVYYPGTEALKPDEMRVIACGTGMPQPRLKHAAACFVVELGNGDKFIFDMGE